MKPIVLIVLNCIKTCCGATSHTKDVKAKIFLCKALGGAGLDDGGMPKRNIVKGSFSTLFV